MKKYLLHITVLVGFIFGFIDGAANVLPLNSFEVLNNTIFAGLHVGVGCLVAGYPSMETSKELIQRSLKFAFVFAAAYFFGALLR